MAHTDVLRSPSEELLSPYKLLVAVLIREYTRLRRELTTDPLKTLKAGSLAKEKERDDCKNYLVKHGIELEELVVSAKESFDTLRLLQHLARSPERNFTSLISLIRLVIIKPHFLLFRRVVELLRRDDPEEIARYVDLNLTQVIQSAKMDNALGSLFVQNVKLLFDEMDFGACDRFHGTIIEYINGAFGHIDEMYNNYTSFIDKTDRLEDPAVSVAYVTESQTDYILGREAELIESNPLAAGDRATMDDQVSRTLSVKPCVENVAYVQFLDAIRRKSYTDALNAIHRYSVLKGLPDERPWLNPDLTAVGLQPGEASLHLCIMHYNAGHHALALQSLKECIFLAQEKGDTHLLSTCMYWLACLEMNNNQYEKLYRGARGGEFLRFPDVMRHFAGLIGRFDAASGASLLKTLHDLNYAETICDATATPNTIALIQQYSGRASVWKLYGFEDIAVVYAQASVQIFSACQTNAFPIATDAVALSLGLLLEQAIRLNDEAALEVLFEYSNETFPVDRSKDWHAWGLAELVWKYQRALNQQNYAECQIVMEQLSLINATEASLKQAELLSAKDLMPKKALNLLNGMYAASQNGTAHVMDLMAFSTRLKLRILLLKSEIYLKSNCGLEALKAAKDALGLAMDHPNALYKAKIQLHLAYIWFHLKEFSQAKNALALCFPSLSGCGYAMDQGRAWFLKGLLGENSTGLERLRCFERALESFSRCFSVEDMLKCLNVIAVMYDKTGSVSERDHVCGLFLTLQERFPDVTVHGPSV